MSISYTKEQRVFARANGLHLTTLAVPGWEMQGPSSAAEVKLIEECMVAVLKLRSEQPTPSDREASEQ